MSGFPINRLVLVGRLTKDPVLRELPSGSNVCWIDGRLTWGEWETSDQQKHERVSIIADTVKFLHASGENPEIDEPQDDEPREDESLDALAAREEFDLVGTGGRTEINYLVY